MSDRRKCEAWSCCRKGIYSFLCGCGKPCWICQEHSNRRKHIIENCRSNSNCAICRISFLSRRARGRDTLLVWAPKNVCAYEVCMYCVWKRFRDGLSWSKFSESIRAIKCIAKSCIACTRPVKSKQRELAKLGISSWKLVSMEDSQAKPATICASCLSRRLITSINEAVRHRRKIRL